jgi:hypothetical protein
MEERENVFKILMVHLLLRESNICKSAQVSSGHVILWIILSTILGTFKVFCLMCKLNISKHSSLSQARSDKVVKFQLFASNPKL